jgi:hypothetical protein
MNTDNNVVSGDAAGNLTGKEYRVVTLTSGGIDLAVAASTKILGTLLRAMPVQEDGTYAGKAVAVQRKHAGIHHATIGNSSAVVAKGAGLILDPSASNPGKLVPSESSPIAAAWEAFTASDGAIVRVVFL